ncbi:MULTISPECIES: Na+/H+ antiporter NhaA [Empedobacter]|uniref:Na(+)/H(+) antiporter NhaA n=1 Tax=Empedobacter falsenii TaxID=343874 RepID=A0A376FYW0_9FLAO|nr:MULTISPECIES: Na+/H+ antiporter NhaA [Empedobacter]MDH0658366.1 Na+/H+ antiporter NhaA [Empedobacter sp. GD03865]MDH1602907.1 Na+/H+ antiporter NhaA [Empedobacter sp. GD03739]STD52851.1 Sodium/proton antiporter nhaA [Empedobacter falsenii]
MIVSKLFQKFIHSQTSGGITLIFCTLFSLIVANSMFADSYQSLWHLDLFGHSFAHWINDGLMAIFFFLIGLELKREMLIGELSNVKKAILPIFAAVGGMLLPAGIFAALNYGTDTINGFGIPMATDIAFAVAVITMLGKRVPMSLKVFLTALAVIDDLGAILVIALFYPNPELPFDITQFGIAMGVLALLFGLNRMKVNTIIPYIIGGIIVWWFMLHSGIHATIAGVLVAFTIPFNKDQSKSLCAKAEHFLHLPVAFIILPLFALANTAITIDGGGFSHFSFPLAAGIFLGLVVGKPIGVTLATFIAVKLGLSELPTAVNFKRVFGAGMLAGIGFTMSIFVSILAFKDPDYVNEAKLMILVASVAAAVFGFFYLKRTLTTRQDYSD